ncbi:MAG: rRNA pseudouridine synthase [Nitrospinae bacterium]|nr:rRNA pseudouridine synthase [Nitrospinota bacterium]
MQMRLQKILAQAGLASRRKAEAWIRTGRISVNGEVVTTIGTQADPERDRIAVDGIPIHRPEPKVYYLLNKPSGYVSTCEDDLGRPTVLDLLQSVKFRIFPIGRLDWDTEGVLLLTNDGALAQRLLHPSSQVPRTYVAKVTGIPTPEALRRLAKLGANPGTPAPLPHTRIVRTGPQHAWVEIRLREGRNRQVRRMCEAVGHPVKRLRRIQFAGLAAEGLPLGRYRPLTPSEILALQRITRLAGRKEGKRPPAALKPVRSR